MRKLTDYTPMQTVAKRNEYFVEYFVSFGEIGRETFATWRAMKFFARQLRPGALLSYGAIHLPDWPKAA